MKTLLTMIMAPLLSWAQPASSQSLGRDLSAYQLVQVFDGKVAKQMPRSLKKVKIQNLKIHKDSLSFQIRGAKFALTLLSGKEHVLRFNGQLFKSNELENVNLARKAIFKKFGLSVKHISWISFLITNVWADTPVDPTEGSMDDAFYSYTFMPDNQPFDLMSTSLAELPQLMGKANTRDALSILGSLLTAVNRFSQTDLGFIQALDLGVPSNSLPVAPNFSTSPHVVR